MENAARNVLFGQTMLFASLLVCALLKPAGLSENDGISYYGIFRETLLPYAAGLLGAAYSLKRAASVLPSNEHVLKQSFSVFALLIFGLVITPYAADRWVNYLHTTFGTALFSLQILLSGWLVWRIRYAWWAVLLTLFELVASILSAAYLNPTHGFLMQSQLLFQLTFGTLLFLSLPRLPSANTAATAKTPSAARRSVRV